MRESTLPDLKSMTRRLDSLIRRGDQLGESGWEGYRADPMDSGPPDPPVDSTGYVSFRVAALHTLPVTRSPRVGRQSAYCQGSLGRRSLLSTSLWATGFDWRSASLAAGSSTG